MNPRAPALAAAASLGLILGIAAGPSMPVDESSFAGEDGAQLMRLDIRALDGGVSVFHCYRLAETLGCPDAPLIDYASTIPPTADIRAAFLVAHKKVTP